MTKLANDAAALAGGGRPIQSLYNGTVQNVAIQVGANASAAFADTTTVIRIVARTNGCWYTIGKAPVATATTSVWLPVGVVEFPQVCRGDKISVIRDAADGSLNIVEGA